jgi:DNA/RNA endonuclease G (NUC1)
MMRFPPRVRGTATAVAALALSALSACTERGLVAPIDQAPTPESSLQALSCRASLADRTVSCASPTLNGVRAQQIGGQAVNVKLTSSNVAYNAVDSIFSFDVTVQNLLAEKMGTRDGVTLDSAGIRVYFSTNPSVTQGTGSATVINADDQGTFTAANQYYFQYDTMLATNEVSPARQWQLKVDPSVVQFGFTLYVATQLQPLLVINELMANPGGAVQDSSGEYVEVYNAGKFPVNMRGMVLTDNANVPDTVNVDLIIPGGQYRTLGRTYNTARNGGITVDYAYTSRIGGTGTSLQFSNSGADFFRIKSPSGVTVDSAGYTSTGVAAKSGVARELKNPALDNSQIDGGNWADATSNYEGSNKGTPGSANSTGTGLPPAGPPATVTVTPPSVDLAPGATRQMNVTARDSLGQLTTTTYTWVMLDSAIARVSTSGLVTAKANGSTSLIVTSANGKADTATINVQAVGYLNHVEFGVPTDGNPNDEIILTKPQYVVSYNPARGGPNWVSWDLNASHFGDAERCDCFSPDPQLPDSVYHVVTGDYTGSGYSRGHMVMSEERTASDAENAATFLMTNVLPQYQDLNGGPWLKFEIYNNDLARVDNKEVYIISGGIFHAGGPTLKGAGIVAIPDSTWKIIVIVPRGTGLSGVHSSADLQVIAVNMPNVLGISGNGWEQYRTTVDAIEASTGYDFLSALPDAIENDVESHQ